MDKPVVHQDVTLTPEGEKIWNEVANPNSEVGKPVGFKHRTFDDFLAEASEKIRLWPKWKRNSLGWAYISEGNA
jgi:hypothetical protein